MKQFVWVERTTPKSFEAFAVSFVALDNPTAWKVVQRHRTRDWPNTRFDSDVRAYSFESGYSTDDPDAAVLAWTRRELDVPEPAVIHKTRNGTLYARI